MALILLGSAAAILLGLTLWLALSYNRLPDLLPLHFDAQGNADRIGERRELLVLPVIGLMIYLVNGVMGMVLRKRFRMVFAAYLLWSGGLLAQILIGLAVWNITH